MSRRKRQNRQRCQEQCACEFKRLKSEAQTERERKQSERVEVAVRMLVMSSTRSQTEGDEAERSRDLLELGLQQWTAWWHDWVIERQTKSEKRNGERDKKRDSHARKKGMKTCHRRCLPSLRPFWAFYIWASIYRHKDRIIDCNTSAVSNENKMTTLLWSRHHEKCEVNFDRCLRSRGMQ